MHEIILLQDLAIVMAGSAITTILCYRFHLPVVLGYIVTGMMIGPHTPPFSFITDLQSIQTLSELGVIFLLFSIGLEFSLSKLSKVGSVAFFAASTEILVMIGIGFYLGRSFGWNLMDSIFLGAILSISSTTIIAKILVEQKKIDEKFAQVILGILIIEDLLAIIIIAVLSGIATSGTLALSQISTSMLMVSIFIIGMLSIGFLIIPRILGYVKRSQISEILVITVIGFCFTGALLAQKFGFSVALGAFLIGAIIAETKSVYEVVQKIEPIRDMFTAVFFVSVGMLIEPKLIINLWFPILLITLATIVGKIFACSLATFFNGYNRNTALKVGLGLAQIGEFSFIIANLGETTKVTSSFLYPIAVSVSALTTISTPFLMTHTEKIVEVTRKISPVWLMAAMDRYNHWLQKERARTRGKKKNLVWRNRIEKILVSMFDSDELSKGKKREKEAIARLIDEKYGTHVETQDFILPYHKTGLNQTIGNLNIRKQTGVSIVAIYRGTETIANPDPDVELNPGDILLLLGNKEQIEKGIRFLNQKLKEK